MKYLFTLFYCLSLNIVFSQCISPLCNQIEKYRRENKELKQEITWLKKKLKDKNEELKKYKAENGQLKAENQRLKEIIAKNDNSQKYKEMLQQSEMKAKEQEATIQALRIESMKLKNENDELLAREQKFKDSHFFVDDDKIAIPYGVELGPVDLKNSKLDFKSPEMSDFIRSLFESVKKSNADYIYVEVEIEIEGNLNSRDKITKQVKDEIGAYCPDCKNIRFNFKASPKTGVSFIINKKKA